MHIKPPTLYVLIVSSGIGALLTGMALHTLWPDWRWHHEPLHSTIEALGGLASIAMAVVLFQRREESTGRRFHALGAGFLGMGLLEAFHAVALPGNGFVLLRNVASLVGGLGFGLLWLPGSEGGGSQRTRVPWIIGIGAIAFGIWTLAVPEEIPEMIRNGEFTPTAVAPQSLACLFFFAGALRFLLDYRQSGRSEDYLFAWLALLFALAELVFMYSVPWDNRWWFWHLLRLIACLLVLGYLSRGYLTMISDLKRSLAQTGQVEKTLRQSEHQLRQALDERERMAQDLHDGIIQSVFAVSLSLERCRRLITTNAQESIGPLGTAIADLKLVIRDLRGYIVGLEPPISNGRELAAALASLVRSMEAPHQLRFDLQVSPVTANRVTPEQAAHVLSIAREAMSNSLRHSGARAGTVSLQSHDGCIRLVVEDDGVGFHAATVPEHGHGLRNMEARARRLGGRLDVISKPGQGTRIVCDLPQESLHAPA
ncbi:MAG: sensor histidine kinase [Nitrospiraceae bacterium]